MHDVRISRFAIHFEVFCLPLCIHYLSLLSVTLYYLLPYCLLHYYRSTLYPYVYIMMWMSVYEADGVVRMNACDYMLHYYLIHYYL